MKDKKRILIFSTAYHPFVGGAEVAIKEITDRLGEDFEFDMLTARMSRNVSKQEKLGNVNIYRIGIGWAFFDKYYLAFFGSFIANKLHKKNKYTAIWSMMASYNSFAALFFKNKNKEVPFLLTLQEGDKFDYILKRAFILKQQFRNIFIKADYIQAISYYLADWAREMGAKNLIEVVPNGVDIKKFSADSFEEKNTKLVITGCSRLEKKNAVKDVVASMQYLPQVELLIMGEGGERQELENLADKLGVRNRVEFFGRYDNDELPKYLRKSSIFVRPSLSEGQGIAFLEAMATGVPIIATSVGGIVDFLEDGKTGLVCEIQNPKSIAEKIKLLMENSELRQEIIENSKQLIEREYNWENIVQEMKRIFNSL